MSVKIDKVELAQKINALEGLDNETKAQLLELLHDRKKYGLVWEDKPEDVEERLREELPVLVEDKSKTIISEDEDAPNHILIEGDNLEALTSLSYTHEGKIDVIYIDPPYNTGNKDFVYNDKFVDTEDEYRHSKWLSFMAKRLKIAKRLLSNEGVIFISIDDNELYPLKMLCDNLLGESNYIATIVVETANGVFGTRASQVKKTFVKVKDYVLVYVKNKSMRQQDFQPLYMPTNELFDTHYSIMLDENLNRISFLDYLKQQQDVINLFQKYEIKLTLDNLSKMMAINSQFEKYIYSLSSRIFQDVDYSLSIPLDIEEQLCLGQTIKYRDTILYRTNGGQGEIRQYISLEKSLKMTDTYIPKYQRAVAIGDLWEGFDEDMKNVAKEGIVSFKNGKKPTRLIRQLIKWANASTSTILDFFAGSGTTLHATMQLNAEDGGHRKCIMVTNNENNICEEVTYERNKRVINGYTTPKGETVEGLHKNTLRYYRTGFVARESSATAKRELMYASADMLCIKNDIYTEQKQFGTLRLRKDVARYFADGNKGMLVIYNPDAIETIVAELKTMEVKTPIITYIFSLNDYAMDADFEEVTDKVKLCALPAAILNAYYKVLPKRKRKENTL